ncbi:MAG: hypothetical protein PHV17_09390 [Candidatus Omnitrophica bacterium]|nr:hypothetical protein [Candidatus Omnitrophota bacterium]
MKNIVVAIILGISFIICVSILVKQFSTVDRYKIIMNNGEGSGLITLKYDTVEGRTWRLALPECYWIEIQDSGMHYVLPDKDKGKNK